MLLLGGDQTQAYRLELGARRRLRALLGAHPDARLLVTGRVVVPAEPLLERLGLRERVELVGRYAQRDAPDLLRRAHLLLHTKVNDPCPTAVIEAMACGLPVVYPASGGTVELVGDEAGIGVPHADSFERDAAAARRGARRGGVTRCSPTGSATPRPPAGVPSSGSRSARGSTGTPSSSPSSTQPEA